ncbi:hypothetical protein [Methylobacterium durans]|uniref:Uncharacterized protein n=1 Tax=Methylobacterium durans TaxID=2202825 RepID=A0A2U8WAF8_9HYPH|nr:hypothetical protein [Methylobacterium durans]AWN43134.1 hypothetical protein DK389_24880 [Methylobacterium durans]
MPTHRPLDWRRALADLKSDRSARPDVREEPLNTRANLRGTPALSLSAWRGRSGRRFVVGVHTLEQASTDDFGSCVAIAVKRNADGIAEMLFAADIDFEIAATGFLVLARRGGANEIHIHRLAASVAERAAIAADLGLLVEEAA